MWSLIKNWKSGLIGLSIVGLLGGTIYFQNKRINKLKNEKDRQTENVRSLLEENQSITMTLDELERYVETSESQFAREIDSVTKANAVKIKDLKKIIATKTEVVIKDTVYLNPVDTIVKVDSLYHLRFQRDNECVSASVIAITIDPNIKVVFEEIECKNETYFMVYKEKKKWWQLFKKRKLMQKTVNTCGETIIKELEIK